MEENTVFPRELCQMVEAQSSIPNFTLKSQKVHIIKISLQVFVHKQLRKNMTRNDAILFFFFTYNLKVSMLSIASLVYENGSFGC